MRDLQNILDKKKANETVDKKDWKKYSGFIFQNSKTQEWCLNATKVQNACKYHGYFAIRTNTIEDPFQSLIIVTVNFSAHCKVKNHFLEFYQAQ